MIQFVLDCSVAISWCLVDESDNYAEAVLALMPDAEAFVPGIWTLEIANTLLVAERRNRMNREQTERAIHFLKPSNRGINSPSKNQSPLKRTLSIRQRF